jgi:hypothetical protein
MTSLDSLSVSRPISRIEHGELECDSLDADLTMPRATQALTPAETTAHASQATLSEPAAAHDPTRLVAALEDIQTQREAIQWLFEADLLCLCLV